MVVFRRFFLRNDKYNTMNNGVRGLCETLFRFGKLCTDFGVNFMDLKALAAAFNKPTQGGEGGSSRFKKFYPFFKMEVGQTATIRFLPDANAENPLGFITENTTHKLTINGETKTVPCLHMYGEQCPICALSQKYYAEGNEALGKKYYKKRDYLAPALVISSPFEYDAPEDIVKIVSFGPKIFKMIQAAFTSGDLDDVPFSFTAGYDFRIRKTQNGEWADYTTSSFAPKATALDPEVIENLTLVNLADFRQPKIDKAVIEQMLNSDLTGAQFVNQGGLNMPARSAAPAPAPVVAAATPAATPAAPAEAAATPAATPAAPASSGKADDLLARIRARASGAQG